MEPSHRRRHRRDEPVEIVDPHLITGHHSRQPLGDEVFDGCIQMENHDRGDIDVSRQPSDPLGFVTEPIELGRPGHLHEATPPIAFEHEDPSRRSADVPVVHPLPSVEVAGHVSGQIHGGEAISVE